MNYYQSSPQNADSTQNANPNLEKPLYLLPQSKARAIVPEIIAFILLGVVFYFGILLNINLLELTAKEETFIKLGSLIILGIIFLIDLLLSSIRSREKYKFYRDHVSFHQNSINYVEMISTTPYKGLLDKIFKTYTVRLGDNFYLRHISKEILIEGYLRKLIEYARSSQQTQN